MKVKDLRLKSTEELEKDFTIFKKELFNLRFQKAQGQPIKTHRVRQIKKTIACINTLLNEMKLGIDTARKTQINNQKKVKEKTVLKELVAKKVTGTKKKPKENENKLNKNKKDA